MPFTAKTIDRIKLAHAVRLIEAGQMGLCRIAQTLRMSYDFFNRELRLHYGPEQWSRIVAGYKERKGFQPGNVPANKGKHYLPEYLKPYLYKKGSLRGWAARNWVPIGTIKIMKIQTSFRKAAKKLTKPKLFRYIKVADEPNVHWKKNWKRYARHLWEKKNGLIPVGKCIVHLDGDTLNDDIDNLFLMTRTGYAQYLEMRFPKLKVRNNKVRSYAARHRKIVPQVPVVRAFIECTSCGFEAEIETERCPKCGGGSFHKVEAKLKGPKKRKACYAGRSRSDLGIAAGHERKAR